MRAQRAQRRVRVVRTYATGRQRVWERYTDHQGWTDWAGGGRVTLEREGEPHRDGVGCIRVIESPGVTVREEVVVFEPPERMVYRLLDNPGVRDHEGEVTFEDLGARRTRVTWKCRFEPKLPGVGWLMERGIGFFFARVLRRLDKVL